MSRHNDTRPDIAARAVTGAVMILGLAVALMASACGGALQLVEGEASHWGAFTKVIDGPLNPGLTTLPAPVREAHCYRVILAANGGRAPQLRFQGELDADSVGFPIMPIESRGSDQGTLVEVFGFCSQGTGTIQLVANLSASGHAAMYEAPFSSLSPTHGRDVAAVHQWLQQRQQERQRQLAAQREAQRQAALEQFATTVGPQLQQTLSQLAVDAGRYTNEILSEARATNESRESFVLEPGFCYFFGVLPHQDTEVLVDVVFTRIRNATEREDVDGAVTYTVCTAPSGPVQETSLQIRARTRPGASTPPAFALLVANRRASPAERRAADQEWVANDPEARIEH